MADHNVGTYLKMPTKRSPPPTPAELARKLGVARLRDFQQAGISKGSVLRLHERGDLERVGRGMYSLPDRELTESESLVQVAKRVPRGVVCLLSALLFYELTDENPTRVWLAIDRKARTPRLDWPRLEVVYWSPPSLDYGVETRVISGVPVRITSPAKTVADCIKYRNKLGTDVAVYALREYRISGRPLGELHAAARVCRVERTLRTYLEVML